MFKYIFCIMLTPHICCASALNPHAKLFIPRGYKISIYNSSTKEWDPASPYLSSSSSPNVTKSVGNVKPLSAYHRSLEQCPGYNEAEKELLSIVMPLMKPSDRRESERE